MSDMSLGIQLTLTGMFVVFLTLIVLSFAMWLTGRLMKEKTMGIKKEKTVRSEKGELSKGEVLAISGALYHYISENEGTVLKFKPLTEWKREARLNSTGRRI